MEKNDIKYIKVNEISNELSIDAVILLYYYNEYCRKKEVMSLADRVFIDMCRDIIETGMSSEGQEVRPRWEDGTLQLYD